MPCCPPMAWCWHTFTPTPSSHWPSSSTFARPTSGCALLVALFHVFFEARLDASGAVSACLTFRLRLSMVMRFIPMPHRD
jgi:hypothetical protein